MSITTNSPTNILSKQVTSGGIITGDTGEYLPLVDRLIRNKFQLFNRSRQKVTSNLYSKTPIKPFQMFTDDKQAGKQFVIGGYQYNPCTDVYTIELVEYDNTTPVNIIKITKI